MDAWINVPSELTTIPTWSSDPLFEKNTKSPGCKLLMFTTYPEPNCAPDECGRLTPNC